MQTARASGIVLIPWGPFPKDKARAAAWDTSRGGNSRRAAPGHSRSTKIVSGVGVLCDPIVSLRQGLRGVSGHDDPGLGASVPHSDV